MNHTKNYTALCLALATLLTTPASAADADQILRGMSAKLGAAQQFSFRAEREIDPALLEGRDLPEKARIDVSVARPDRLVARSVSGDGTRRVIANGRTLTVFDQKMNHFAQVPMRTSLDGLVAQLDEKYGFTPPLAEFALSDTYQDIRRQAHSITYLGTARVGGGLLGFGGVECHRLGLKGKVADAELWIAVGDQLPRKLVATFHRDGKSQVRINFLSWNLTAPVNTADFTFTPPAGSEKIEMWTKSRMQAAR